MEELTDEELSKLPFEQQLEYLDRLAAYLKSIPSYPSKRDNGIVKAMNQNGYLTGKKLSS